MNAEQGHFVMNVGWGIMRYALNNAIFILQIIAFCAVVGTLFGLIAAPFAYLSGMNTREVIELTATAITALTTVMIGIGIFVIIFPDEMRIDDE